MLNLQILLVITICLFTRAKYPVTVHVWGGISRRGKTNVVIFSGIMNAEGYAKSL